MRRSSSSIAIANSTASWSRWRCGRAGEEGEGGREGRDGREGEGECFGSCKSRDVAEPSKV